MIRTAITVSLVLAAGNLAFAGDAPAKPAGSDKKAEAKTADAKPAAKKKLFMDVHRNLPKNMTDAQLAEGHNKDMAAEKKLNNGAHYVRGFYDKDKGVLFCQCEAAKKEDCEAIHVAASGHAADEIYEIEAK